MPENPLQDADTLRSLAASMGYFVDAMEGLRQHSGPATDRTAGQIFLRGYRRPGDGGEGYFLWNRGGTAPDDGGTVINPTGNDGAGRWVRMTRGAFATPLWWGASFDDTADDSAPIQAAIDFAVATGGDVLLPPGTAKITRPLVLSSNGAGNRSGFRFAGRGKFGDGNSSIRDGSGTLIKYYGEANSAEAILTIDRSLWRYTTVADLSLLAVTAFAAKFGLLFNSTEFSKHTIENVTVARVKVGYGIAMGTGGNGEFTYFRNCDADQVGVFFYNNSGQAFTQRFEHCGCGLLPGGTYFVLDIKSGISPGGGLIVTDFDATGGGAGDPNPPTNTTLLHTGESMTPVSFQGGRIEHLTRLVDLAPNFLGLNLSIRDMDITVDCDPTLPKHAVGSFVTVRDNPAVVSISDCSFSGAHGREVLGIDVGECRQYGPSIMFARCIFGGFLAVPKVIGSRHDTATSVKFTDCRTSNNFVSPLRGGKSTDDRRRPLNYGWGGEEANEAMRARRLSSSNARIASGRPANLLVSPAFHGFATSVASIDPPWVPMGLAGLRISCPSAWGRILSLPPGGGLFQDIPGTDLAADAGTTSYFGAPVHDLYYQAHLSAISGGGSLRFAIEDSVTGEAYDELVLTSTSERPSGPRLVSLAAHIPPTGRPSAFRLKINNPGLHNIITLQLEWQCASDRSSASYIGINGVAEMAADWALSTESLRAWDRFMLPYKSDATAAASPRGQADLYSDQYVSSDDGRLTYYGADGWFKAPRTIYAAGPPEHGAWRAGDQALNQQPKTGSYVGWVCVAAGSPGEWRPFGLIA